MTGSTTSKLKQRLKVEGQVHKAYKVLLKLQNPKYFDKDKTIPLRVIKQAQGIAFVTVLKAGFVFNGTIGSGIIVSRLPDGSWSGPCSLGVIGMGWGALIGASATDAVIILNTRSAVRAFTSKGQIKFGGNLSFALGPIGREVDGSVYGGNQGVVACYSYSHSRGLFGGLSLQGAVLVVRDRDNERFYDRSVLAGEILSGRVTVPCTSNLQLLYETLSNIDRMPLESWEMDQSNIAGSASRSLPTIDANAPDIPRAQYLGEAPTTVRRSSSQEDEYGWEEMRTQSGERFFYNRVTHETKWDYRPIGTVS